MNASSKLLPQPTVLSIGAHLTPHDGACLMEVVSQAAGEPWSDAPACTHPLLGHLARLVNDTVSDPGRQQLVAFVPALAAATSSDPSTYPRLAMACTGRALRTNPSPLLLTHLDHVARVQMRHEQEPGACTGSMARARRALYRRGPATRAVEASVAAVCRLPERERDVELLALLVAGLEAVTRSSTRSG